MATQGKNVFRLLLSLGSTIILALAGLSGPLMSQNSYHAANAQQPEDYLSYVNADYGISIDYPQDWEKVEYPGNYPVAFYSPYEDDEDQFAEYVGIFVGASAGNMLDEYVDDYLEKMEESFPELEVVEDVSTTFAGTPARKLVTSDTDFDQDGNLDQKSMRVFMLKDTRAYVIIYDAVQGKYDAYLPIVEDMIASVAIDTTHLAPQMTGANSLTYKNSTYNVQIEYPDNWDVVGSSQNENSIAFFYSPFDNDFDAYQEYVGIGYEDVPVGTSLGEYTQGTIASFTEGTSNFEMIESRDTVLSGNLAHKITFTASSFEFGETKSTATWTLKDDRAYLLYFDSQASTYDRYIPAAQDMIDSFVILQGSGNQDDESTGELIPYDNPGQAFAMTYPDNWEKTESSEQEAIMTGDVATFASPREDGFVSVSIQSLYWQPMTLDEYTDLSMDSLDKDVSLLDVKESGPVLLAGHPGHRVVYSGLYTFFGDTAVSVEALQVWTVVENRAYILTYVSNPETFETYLPIAQDMIDSLEIDADEIPKRVEGKYENSELGLSVDLPKDWIGVVGNSEFKKYLPFDNTVVIFPDLGDALEPSAGGEQDADEFLEQLLSSFMIILSMNTEDVLHGKLAQFNSNATESEGDCDSPRGGTVVDIEGIRALKMEIQCVLSDSEYLAVLYLIVTDKDTIGLVFYGSEDYQENLALFEDSIKTLKVQNAVDLMDPTAISNVIGEEKRELTKHEVFVDGNPYELPVLSSSTVTDFKLVSDKKQVSFKVEGEDNTMGAVEIELGQVLKGPYSVMVDGVVAENTFTINDNATGRTILTFSYPHSVHDITITGTTVVPEFGSLAFLILALGIVPIITAITLMNRRNNSL